MPEAVLLFQQLAPDQSTESACNAAAEALLMADANSDERLSKREFQQLLSKLWDKAGIGAICFEELCLGLAKFRPIHSKEDVLHTMTEAASILALHSNNSNMQLDLEGFATFMSRFMSAAGYQLDDVLEQLITLAATKPDTALLNAVKNITLGVGFSGSGFLIFYYTGVVAVIRALGVVNDKTKLAGASSGSIHSAAICSGLDYQQQFDANSQLADFCRGKNACQGYLGAAARNATNKVFPPDVVQRCEGRLTVAVTQAKPGTQPDVGVLISSFNSRDQLLDTVAGSSWIPYFSGSQPVFITGDRAYYDGGFTIRIPCPEGVSYCLRVGHWAKQPGTPLGESPEVMTAAFNASNHMYLALLSAFGERGANKASSVYLPLNPILQPVISPSIYPGLSGKWNVPADQWNGMGLRVPDKATLVKVFDQGRADAAAWATQQPGLTTAAAVQKALSTTQLKSS
eukprot:gene13202-13333_t